MKTSDLRVISGRYKGQRLRSPESSLTHPMGSREKLTLFNLLQPYLDTASTVLDLYAGSGALGIEALSRGAREAIFVEKSPKIARLISENLSSLNPQPSASVAVLTTSVTQICQSSEYLSYFDIIIADPPYDNFHPEDLASISQILSPSGVFALSSPAKIDPPEIPELRPQITRTYAAARLTIYRKSL